jgi:ribosomal protein L7/L12
MDNFLADNFFLLMGTGALIAIGLLLYIMRGQKPANTAITGPAIEAVQFEPASFEPVNFEPVQTDVEAEVRMLVDFGNNAEAIRVLQKKIGFDLQDAKAVVSQMGHGTPLRVLSSDSTATTESGPDAEARQLVSDGKLITAITLVREQKGLGLKEAKAYVERL